MSLSDSSPETAAPTDQVDASPEVASGQPTQTDVKTPEVASTPEVKSGDPPSMLDAVKSALKPKADAAPASPASEKEPPALDPAKTEDTQSEEEKELSEDELKSLSARTQRRFRKLNSEVKTRDELVKQLSPKAEEFDRLDQFVRGAGLSPTDVQGTLRIASQLRSDPHAAYEALLPIMQHLEQAVGNVIPQELAQRVQAGYLTEQDALAISRSASHARASQQQLEQERAQQQEWSQRNQRQQQISSSVSTVESWEKQQAARDPDWNLKQPDIREIAELEISRRYLADRSWTPSPDESMKIAKAAYDKVNERFKRFTPRPTAVARDPSGGGASPSSAPAPKSMEDAVRMAARGEYRR